MFATEMGKLMVHPGEVFSGGEIIRDGRQTGFDLISNIQSVHDGTLYGAYELTITRMTCIPDPPEPTNYVDLDAQGEIGHILDKADEKNEVFGTEIDQVVQVVEPTEEVFEHAEQVEQFEQPVVVQQNPIPYYPVVYRPRCFAGDAQVITSRGRIFMKELVVGDLVLTKHENTTRFTKVISFLHRLPNEQAHFIEFEFSDGNLLKLTKYHFIYRVSCSSRTGSTIISTTQMIYAQDLHINDCVFTLNGDTNQFQRSSVITRRHLWETGAYAPLTESGDILANNVLVSCHDFVRPSGLTQTFMYYMHRVSEWLRVSEDQNLVELPIGVQFLIEILDQIIPMTQN